MRRRFLLSAFAAAASSAWLPVFAQSTSDSADVTDIIVPFSAGGSTDLMARIVGKGAAKMLGGQVVVINQPGAGGAIAAASIKRFDPDGRHVLLGTIAALSIYPILYKAQVTYDPIKDFAPVMLAATLPLVFVVPSKSPFKTFQDLTNYLKQHGNSANYGSAGIGSSPHLGVELYKNLAHVKATHVPYKGGSPALLALASGEVTFMEAVVPEAKPYIDSGKLRALAVSTKERIPDLPGVPTVSESGIPDYEITSWYGFLVRAGTPESTIMKLNKALNAAISDEKAAAMLKNMGFILKGGSPEILRSYMKTELDKWRKVIDEAHITVK